MQGASKEHVAVCELAQASHNIVACSFTVAGHHGVLTTVNNASIAVTSSLPPYCDLPTKHADGLLHYVTDPLVNLLPMSIELYDIAQCWQTVATLATTECECMETAHSMQSFRYCSIRLSS